MIKIATFSLSNATTNSMDTQISGLTYPFDTDHYLECGAFDVDFVDGTLTPPLPANLKWGVSAPSPTGSTTVNGFIGGLNSNTSYTFYGYAKTLDNRYYKTGSATLSTLLPQQPVVPTIAFDSKTSTSIQITRTVSDGVTGINTEMSINNSTFYDIPTFCSLYGASYSVAGAYLLVSGLTPSTNYYFRAYGDLNGYNSAYSSTLTIATNPPPSPEIPSSPISATRIEGGLNLTWGSSTYATSYTLEYVNYLGTYQVTGITSTSYSLTNLLFGVTYTLRVKGVNAYGSSSFTSDDITTTAPQTPTISQATVTANSITINIGNISGNYDVVRVYKNFDAFDYIDGYSNSSVTFTGLTAGATYNFYAKSRYTPSSLIESVSFSNTLTIVTTARPTNWTWSYTIASGSPVYSTVGKKVNIMTATEWNLFTTRINLFRNYVLGSGNEYGFSTTNSGSIHTTSETMLRINEAIIAINGCGFSQSTLTSSSSLAASIFTTMKSNLDSIP